MSSQRRVCKFFNKPGGCHKGSTCPFSHDGTEGPPARGVHRSGASFTIPNDAWRRVVGPGELAGGNGQVPSGVCKGFWNDGTCRFNLNCRYEHRSKPETSEGRAIKGSTSRVPLAPPEDSNTLSEGELISRIVSSTSTDALFPIRNPKAFHIVGNQLRVFLNEDRFRIQRTREATTFVELLGHSNSVYGVWSHEDRQLLLDNLTSNTSTGNGYRHLNTVLSGSAFQDASFEDHILPLLGLFTSHAIIQSVRQQSVNALYALVNENFDSLSVYACHWMDSRLSRMELGLMGGLTHPRSCRFLITITITLIEFVSRYKRALLDHAKLLDLVDKLLIWFESWKALAESHRTSLEAPLEKACTSPKVVEYAHKTLKRLVTHCQRENVQHIFPGEFTTSVPPSGSNVNVNALQLAYEGPGEYRIAGPRHDNDFSDIKDIRIAPTHDELTSTLSPYLPFNLPNAPHHYPSDSMHRLLDIHFRLLREELIASLRDSVQLLKDDLSSPRFAASTLGRLVETQGGFYKGYINKESFIFPVYTNVTFEKIFPDRSGLAASIIFDTPPGRARAADAGARATYWEHSAKRRLSPGALVALLWKTDSDFQVYLGTVCTSTKDLAKSARSSRHSLSLGVCFFESSIYTLILNNLKQSEKPSSDVRLFIESSVMFESIRPFLDSLRNDPTSLPFERYLAHPTSSILKNVVPDPPLYSTVNGFEYELAPLFNADAGIESLKLVTTNQESIMRARETLKSPHPLNAACPRSTLDPSQSDAMVDMLTSELGLMQGPPGTGKSYTGVKLINLLLDNKVKPVLLIAFTNHALDHLLKSILDTRPSTSAIRLGSRSSDPKIAGLSLDSIEGMSDRSRLSPVLGKVYAQLKGIEKEMEELMKKATKREASSSDVLEFLESDDDAYHHYHSLTSPSPWIDCLYHETIAEEATWTQVGNRDTQIKNEYDFWKAGEDLNFLDRVRTEASNKTESATDDEEDASPQQHTESQLSELERDSDLESSSMSDDASSEVTSEASERGLEYFWMFENATSRIRPAQSQPEELREVMSTKDSVPDSPPLGAITSQALLLLLSDPMGFPHPIQYERDLYELLIPHNVWLLTRTERLKLAEHWERQAHQHNCEIVRLGFEDLRKRHERTQQRWSELKEESKITLLKRADLIACTTNGAAKLTRMLKAVSPRVLVVEEAGQVLEAHVLSSLVPSVQHLVLIGDPLQLRPTISNYSLSMDHPGSGSKLYRLDQSLMERLSSLGYPMSPLNVQRRMRPEVADLVRTTLYPNLEDHPRVSEYPRMRGLGTNVFFLDHRFGESGEEESSSKTNKYEAAMIRDLVLHLLKQGVYSGEGDIVVLCAYLGQLAEVRKLLSSEVTTVLDDRDLAQLEEANPGAEEPELVQGSSGDIQQVHHVAVSRRVLLRTVDNFQGEEAEVVILSLVRNTGEDTFDGGTVSHGIRPNKGTIGYLKSRNRTNVALSRAKQGLYILGDASLLASRSSMWKSIVDLLTDRGSLGTRIPICCHVHREDGPTYVNLPGQIQRCAPDGGCLRPCGGRMPCGHLCTFKCHSDDPKHIGMKCQQSCAKLCPRGHPCPRRCFEPCGDCPFPVYNVSLPCGDVKPKTTCTLSSRPEDISCDVEKEKALPGCEHFAKMLCGKDPSLHDCTAPCNRALPCCGKTCGAKCSECAVLDPVDASIRTRVRIEHKTHTCDKQLRCGHRCTEPCSSDHQCSGKCTAKCRQTCKHHSCDKICSEACRPCLAPCTWCCPHVSCNVPCGSICTRLPCDIACQKLLSCGHPCPSVCGEVCEFQTCPVCASVDQKSTVVDFILQLTLEDLDFALEGLDNRLITLECGHFFTVETLDGICHLRDFYDVDESERWIRPRNPEANIIEHPVCPLCRRDITSPRYGRVLKRAKLDLLEHNLASRLSRSVSSIKAEMHTFDLEMSLRNVEVEAAKYRVATADPESPSPRKQSKAFEKLMSRNDTKLVPIHGFAKLSGIHPFPQKWRDSAAKLLKGYAKAEQVATTRSAHLQAYEAAFSGLYTEALNEGGDREARRPEQFAMMLAKMRIGQPKPSADKRFQVEALWVSIRIRFHLAELGLAWLRALPDTAETTAGHRSRWLNFTLFLFKSSLKDAELAFNISQETSSHRKMAQSAVMVEEAKFELFQFNWTAVLLTENALDGGTRDGFGFKVEEGIVLFEQAREDCRQMYLQSRPGDEEWLNLNLDQPVETLRRQWHDIQLSITRGTFYQSVSREEKQAILQAFERELGFEVRGHFYQCDNGHTYVIGECGGAMQASTCPECGVRIGGQQHNLTSGNRRDTELEGLAAARGAGPSPWLHGQGI